MENYTLITRFDGSQVIQRQSDRAYIPIDSSNVDYEAYLTWIRAGNTANTLSTN